MKETAQAAPWELESVTESEVPNCLDKARVRSYIKVIGRH